MLGDATLEAALAVLGALLVRGSGPDRRVGRIVEVEAYLGGDDQASHARLGRTKRNAVMFGPPGVAYVYLVYGMYHCLNIVTETDGMPAALLVRAIEPVAGEAEMRQARIDAAIARAAGRGPGVGDVARRRLAALPTPRLASGPGLVCAAFSIDRSDDGTDLCAGGIGLRLEAASPGELPLTIARAPRVGIGYAPEPSLSAPWRFFVAGSPAVSGPIRGAASRPGADA